MIRTVLIVALALGSTPALAQQPDWLGGHVSVLFSVMPDVAEATGRQPVTELRTRLFTEARPQVGDRLRVNLGLWVDGLIADRDPLGAPGQARDALVRPADLYVEVRGARYDLRAGYSRIVWGRLDEFQPSDVVNPLDVSRFFLEGRSEARLPVAMVRGRLFLPHSVAIEGVLVPVYRAGRFDQLDEETSPFRLSSPQFAICPEGPESCVPLVPVRLEPERAWRNVQGGARVTGTAGRVDLGASVYRGFEPFPSWAIGSTPVPGPGQGIRYTLRETFPRFTMIAGDFEAVRGPWGLRGELAWFPEDTLQSLSALTPVPGQTLQGGIGVDRRAGAYRVSGNVLVVRSRVDAEALAAKAFPFDEEVEDTAVTLIGWAERSFARETRRVRLLGVYDPEAQSAFVRGVAAFSLRDNVWLEGSAGWLRGDGLDTLGRLSRRDFLYTRLMVHF